MPAGKHKFRLPVKRAQKRGFPLVPDAWPDRANVANGENKQHFETFQSLDAAGEVGNCCPVAEIAPLRRVRHDEMVLDEPLDRRGFGGREAKAWTQRSRDGNPSLAMILDPPFGDIVQK